MMTENGVKKAKEKAIEHFWELFPRSNFSVWINVFHRVRLQIKYPDNEHGNSIYFCGVTEVGSKRISRKREGSRAALNINLFLLIRLY